MKTTETVNESGLYSSECCNVEVVFEDGETFSRCPQCQHLCIWEFDNEIAASDNQPGPKDGIAA